jgi:hypothetical protein
MLLKKTVISTACAIATFAITTSSYAGDRFIHRHKPDYVRHSLPHNYHGHTHNHYVNKSSSDWVGPAVFGGILVYALTQANKPAPPAHRVVYAETAVMQPQVIVVPSGLPSAAQNSHSYYYCQSTRSYYPQIMSCNEPWVVLPSEPPR